MEDLSLGLSCVPRPMSLPPAGELLEALLAGLAASGVAACLCDPDDTVRYVNASFRASFCPDHDGRPAPFVEVIGAGIRDGTGIRLTTTDLETFSARISARRLSQTGTLSFATDTVDGRWWWVSDTKLDSGWMLVVAQDISSLKYQEFALRDAHATALEEAQTDDLTGAPNRRQGLRRAEAAVEAAHAGGGGVTAALMDIDHFKAINDRYGHDAGDRALRHFAHVLSAALGADEQFCRLGGDEFLMISHAASALDLEARLGAVFEAMPLLAVQGAREGLRLSISVGIARLEPHEDWPALLRRADSALYAAKAGGRDRIARAA